MKDPENIVEIAALAPDFMGFIFYPPSPRYAGNLDPGTVRKIPSHIIKTGVFVNETADTILNTMEKYDLQAVQLHGEESPGLCLQCKKQGMVVIKAIPVSGRLDEQLINSYESSVDYLLFDTRSPGKGGSGKKFDWSVLRQYHAHLPFFLSGGITPEDAEEIVKRIHQPQFIGIDINSGFETAPGIKNIEQVKVFIEKIRSHEPLPG